MPQVAVCEGLFTTDDEGSVRLIGGRCTTCDRHSFPAGELCPWCGAAPVDQVLLSANGTLWGFTTIGTAPPGYRGPVPFGFGVVELTEGIRIVTRLGRADTSALEFGMPMRVTTDVVGIDDDGNETVTWSFTPEGAR
jgi:uncharacterized protein